MVIINSSLHPEASLDEQIASLTETGVPERCFALSFSCCQHYLPGEPSIQLLALVAIKSGPEGIDLSVGIMRQTPPLTERVHSLPAGIPALKAFAEQQGSPWLNLSSPLQLSPVIIAKPWGKEVWYTGVEARGQSAVVAKGRKTPLPWLLALAPGRLVGGRPRQLLLLKILDPHPDKVLGDLYFEVHQCKREVYIVTHIDPRAWPGGMAGVRYGFSPQKRARYASDATFKADYLAAVNAYEKLRRELDAELDRKRQSLGIDLNEPMPVEMLSRWHRQLEPELVTAERQLREAMESFTAVRPLTLGDVIKVPPLTPHALLHGVRVVEFQSPSYERQILSFNQKVLNQSHWDTAQVIDEVNLETPTQHPPRHWVPTPGVQIEELADFQDFAVIRISMEAGQSVSLARLRRCFPGRHEEPDYSILMGLEGVLSWAGVSGPVVRPGEAQLVPGLCSSGALVSEQNAVWLMAVPRGQE